MPATLTPRAPLTSDEIRTLVDTLGDGYTATTRLGRWFNTEVQVTDRSNQTYRQIIDEGTEVLDAWTWVISSIPVLMGGQS